MWNPFEKKPEPVQERQEAPRPTEEDVEVVVDRVLSQRGNNDSQFAFVVNDFRNWAEGGERDPRSSAYPGWTDKDFQDVVDALKKKIEPEFFE